MSQRVFCSVNATLDEASAHDVAAHKPDRAFISDPTLMRTLSAMTSWRPHRGIAGRMTTWKASMTRASTLSTTPANQIACSSLEGPLHEPVRFKLQGSGSSPCCVTWR